MRKSTSKHVFISLTDSMKNRGPNTEPRGTPEVETDSLVPKPS